MFAVDIAGFTEPYRDDDIRLYLHEELYELLERAFDGSGIPWARCFHEDRGDGALIVVPPDVASKGIIDPLPERLRSLIRRHNHVSCQAAGIQLRAAAHIGPVEHDGHGFVGTDINLLFRMLEARPLRKALAGSGAELALMVSEDVYRSLVCRCPSLVSPYAFQRVRFQVKQTRGRAWIYLPGAPSPGVRVKATGLQGTVEGVALVRVAGLVAGREPALALRRRAMRPGLRVPRPPPPSATVRPLTPRRS